MHSTAAAPRISQRTRARARALCVDRRMAADARRAYVATCAASQQCNALPSGLLNGSRAKTAQTC
eukprot:6336842-Lingulodinium_polyedra.AAC.1